MEKLCYYTFKFLCFGIVCNFTANRKTPFSCPPLRLGSARVTQTSPAEGPRCRDVIILVKRAAGAVLPSAGPSLGNPKDRECDLPSSASPGNQDMFSRRMKDQEKRATPKYTCVCFVFILGIYRLGSIFLFLCASPLTSLLTR